MKWFNPTLYEQFLVCSMMFAWLFYIRYALWNKDNRKITENFFDKQLFKKSLDQTMFLIKRILPFQIIFYVIMYGQKALHLNSIMYLSQMIVGLFISGIIMHRFDLIKPIEVKTFKKWM